MFGRFCSFSTVFGQVWSKMAKIDPEIGSSWRGCSGCVTVSMRTANESWNAQKFCSRPRPIFRPDFSLTHKICCCDFALGCVCWKALKGSSETSWAECKLNRLICNSHREIRDICHLKANHLRPHSSTYLLFFCWVSSDPSLLLCLLSRKVLWIFFCICLGILHWKMAGIFGEFFLVSVSHETKHENSSKNSRKFRSKIRGKIRDENSKNSGNFRSATFLT